MPCVLSVLCERVSTPDLPPGTLGETLPDKPTGASSVWTCTKSSQLAG